MQVLSSFSGLIYSLLAIAGFAAMAWVFNRQRQRDIADVQDRVIALQREEIKSLSDRLEGQQQEIAQLHATISTIRVALKRRGITVRVNGEFVTVEDAGTRGKQDVTVRIRKDEAQALADGDDEDA